MNIAQGETDNLNELSVQEQEEMHRKALVEKTIAAEKNGSKIRFTVILFSLALFFAYKAPGTNPLLAYLLVGVICLYGFYVFFAKPFKEQTIKLVSSLTYAGDVLFTTLWIYATGCWNSPYFIIYYVSIIAVAFRYNTRTVILTAGLYTLCYLSLLLMFNQLYPHLAEALYRCAFIFICGYFSTMITRETYMQTHEKLKLKQLTNELKATEAELRNKTNALKGINDELEVMVEERTQELQQSANRFKQLIDSVPLIAWTTDAEGNTTYRNATFHEFVGDMVSNDIENFIHPDDTKFVWALWATAKESGKPMELEYRWKRHDDTYVWMLARVISIRNEKNEIIFWLGTAVDINEQKKLLEQKDQFIGVASHELKTPLTSVKAYAQLVDQSLSADEYEGAKIFIKKTYLYISRMEQLIKDLLDVSRIQGGKMSYHMSEFEFTSFAEEAINDIKQLNPGYNIQLRQSGPVTVYGDKHRIEQVLDNLISNAIKYSKNEKDIEVSVLKEYKSLHVIVKDRGVGIPKEKVSRIFDRFYRVNEDTPVSGLGLGLFIVKEIITRHDGEIWVDSEVGKGTAIHFTLPYAPPAV